MITIKKLELVHFGKFKDTVIDLKNGENRFLEANEWGKSTITDFIIYMLYGFKKTTKKGITVEQNLLKKYLPWDDDSHIFGAMELECDGSRVRIERKTLASGRMTLAVRDAGGNALDILEPGVTFFGVDSETFIRTFLVRQTDIVFDGTGDIETALRNLVTTGDEETSFDAALKVIVDKKNKFQHGDRRSGRIFDLPKLITDKKLERSQLLAKKDALASSLLEYNDLKEKLSAVQKTEAELESKREASVGNDAKKTLLRAEQIIAERDSYANKAGDTNAQVTESDVKTASEIFNGCEIAKTYYQNAKTQLQNAKAELENSKLELAGVEYVAGNEQKIEQHLAKKAKANIPLIALGAVIALVSAVLSVAITPFFAIGVMVGVMLVVLSFGNGKPKPLFDKTNEQLSADLEKYRSVFADTEQKQAAFERAAAEVEKQRQAFEAAEDDVIKIKEKYNITEPSEMSSLLVESKNADMLRGHIERLGRELATLLQGKTLDELRALSQKSDGSDLGVLELDKMRAQVSKQKSELAIDIAGLEKARIDCLDLDEKINSIALEIKALEAELLDAEYQNEMLGVCRDVLCEAYEKINSVYSPIISEKISPYLATLTGGKYRDAILDRQFNIRVKYKGEFRELGFFSRGTADCVYLATRLAIAEILEGQNALPLILDDPFWSFDEDRLKNAHELINSLAQKRQILVFCAR